MDLHLSGHVAVVIGGASGIGLAIAKEFAREGCRVGMIDRNTETPRLAGDLQSREVRRGSPTPTEHRPEVSQVVREAAGDLRSEASAGSGDPRTTIGLVADVTDFAAMQAAATQVAAALGNVQHVVYAAGCGSGKFGFPFWNLEPGDWDRVLRVNLLGAMHTAHAFAPSLVDKKQGTMLFVSSVAGQIGSQTDPPYSSAKAGLINFAQVAAKDLAPHSVRVNTICPGMVQTPLNRAVWQAWNDRQPDAHKQTYDQWAGAKVKQMCPLGKWQTPEEIANLAVFLASDRAASITGQTMNVDGGWVMHW